MAYCGGFGIVEVIFTVVVFTFLIPACFDDVFDEERSRLVYLYPKDEVAPLNCEAFSVLDCKEGFTCWVL